VEWAITSFKPYKASGTDGISLILLQEGLGTLLCPLSKVFSASIVLIYVPQAWRFTKVVFMPKPGKNGHIKVKYFSPISLISFLLNIFERLVDRFLKNGSLIEHPIFAFQYAYREGRSAETALHHFINKVEVQLEAKG
jgi:hypothetical protein